MRPRTCRNLPSSRTIRLCLILICLSVGGTVTLGSSRGVVVVREDVSQARRQELAKQLRAISGWPGLDFDSHGVLCLGAGDTDSGSQSARALLRQAVDGNNVIVIEEASSRPDVAFCRVVPARWLTKSGSKLPAFVVLIDFADFHQILGDDEARAAFNVGWGFLHEVDHVVADSKDAAEEERLGECETHINAMRREIGLPQRVNYFFTESALRTDPNFGSKLVRLAFEQYDSNNMRTRRYWLVWDSTVVGGLVVKSQTAALRAAPRLRD